MYPILINFGVFVGLIVLALVTGTILEMRHFRSIKERETALQYLPVLTTREYPTDRLVERTQLVSGNVVVSVDYFKRFLAGLRNIFGGEVRSYGSLLDRGRREAILRMKEQWPEADMIVNLRIETSSISKGQSNGKHQSIGSTEVLAYGTAIMFCPDGRI
jgi:uncharacterized protein YbjQ (UPF0145 family)